MSFGFEVLRIYDFCCLQFQGFLKGFTNLLKGIINVLMVLRVFDEFLLFLILVALSHFQNMFRQLGSCPPQKWLEESQ